MWWSLTCNRVKPRLRITLSFFLSRGFGLPSRWAALRLWRILTMELNRWHLHLAASAAKLLVSEARQSFFLFLFPLFSSLPFKQANIGWLSREVSSSSSLLNFFFFFFVFNGALCHVNNAAMYDCAQIKEHQQESYCISRIRKKMSDERSAISNSHARVLWISIRKSREVDDSRPRSFLLYRSIPAFKQKFQFSIFWRYQK